MMYTCLVCEEGAVSRADPGAAESYRLAGNFILDKQMFNVKP